MAPLLLSYGKALYELAFSQQGVMGKEEVEKTADQGELAPERLEVDWIANGKLEQQRKIPNRPARSSHLQNLLSRMMSRGTRRVVPELMARVARRMTLPVLQVKEKEAKDPPVRRQKMQVNKAGTRRKHSTSWRMITMQHGKCLMWRGRSTPRWWMRRLRGRRRRCS